MVALLASVRMSWNVTIYYIKKLWQLSNGTRCRYLPVIWTLKNYNSSFKMTLSWLSETEIKPPGYILSIKKLYLSQKIAHTIISALSLMLDVRLWFTLPWFWASEIHVSGKNINKLYDLRPPSCTDGPFSSCLTQKCSKEGKKVSQFQAFLVATVISGLWPKKWVFCPKHKNATPDFTYFVVFYHISSWEPSGERGETGKWIYFECTQNHILVDFNEKN